MSIPFTIALDDGEVIRGEVRVPAGTTPVSAVVVVHGFKGFRRWGFFPHSCDALASDGHAVVSFDFSLNGIGPDGESFTRLEAFERNTLSREVNELLRVLHEVRSGNLGLEPPRRIGVLGHSRGGGIAVLASLEDAVSRPGGDAALHPGGHSGQAGPDALVTWAAVARFGTWSEDLKAEWRRNGRIHVLNSRTGQQLPLGRGLLDDFETNRKRLDVEGAARELANFDVPWLIVHGEDDPTVSEADARQLAGAHPGATLELVPGAGHTFGARHPFEGSGPELDRVLDSTRRHFRRHLSRDG